LCSGFLSAICVIVAFVRTIRHRYLNGLAAVWRPLGRVWRWAMLRFGSSFTAWHKVGSYGPFLLDGFFAFSDFANWGRKHNNGFVACVEACRNRRCVVDVGAHVGLVTLPMASVLATGGIVVAFEPAKANRVFLQRHVRLNNFEDRVRIDHRLVGARELSSVPFFELDEATGMNTVVQDARQKNARLTSIPQTSLDAYCLENGLSPEIVKIDVEGAELDVLEGARSILTQDRPTIFLSVHPLQIAAFGRSTDELVDLMNELGYNIRGMDGSAVSVFALREYVLTPKVSSAKLSNDADLF
jgi:FkbM family methyltransferase